MSELHAETANQGYVVEYKIVTEKVDLRDQFAMAALSALLHMESVETVRDTTKAAYYIADFMLKAREEK